MKAILLTLGLCLLAPSAEAAHQPFRQAVHARHAAQHVRHHRHAGARFATRSHGRRQYRDPLGQVVEHPAGCPWREFCGCGAAVEVFGRPIRALWLAKAWFGFPSAAPAAGMAVVWQHHVAVIREYLGGGRAVVYDANSGGHLTRVHVRSLAGGHIVNPRGRA